MHSQRATLLIISNGLDHRTEDIWVNLSPVQIANVKEVGTGDLAEPWNLNTSGEQTAIHIRETLCPSWQAHSLTISCPGVHGPEDFANHFMGIRRIPGTHLLYCVSEEAFTGKNIGVFSKEAENQPGHKVVHFMALLTAAPIRVIFQQFNIKAVQA